MNKYYPGWWFGTCFIFPYIGINHPNWLSYFSEGFSEPPTRYVLFAACQGDCSWVASAAGRMWCPLWIWTGGDWGLDGHGRHGAQGYKGYTTGTQKLTLKSSFLRCERTPIFDQICEQQAVPFFCWLWLLRAQRSRGELSYDLYAKHLLADMNTSTSLSSSWRQKSGLQMIRWLVQILVPTSCKNLLG